MNVKEQESFHFDRQEGVHFLTDLYSVLGVEREADADAIKEAYREKARHYHPDRYQGLAPEMGRSAEFQMRVINRANDILGTDSKRQVYDEVLSSWDGPISTNGYPVVELSRMFYGAETSPQAKRFAEAMNETGVSQIGFDEKLLAMAEKLYESTGGNVDAARLLDEQLRKKQMDVNFREATLREVLGIEKANQLYPSPYYLMEARDAVERGKNETREREEKSAMLLKSGIVHLLTTGEAEGSFQDSSVALTDGSEVYEAGSEEILALAKENEEIIEQRLELIKGNYIGKQEESFDKVIIQLIMADKVMHMAFERTDTTMNQLELDEETLIDACTEEEAVRAYAEGMNVISVTVPEGLPFLSVMEQVITDHYSFTVEDEEEIS